MAVSDHLIEATRWVGPPIFFGNAGATTASVVAFWAVFYVWIGSEFWLGYRRRLRDGATSHDAGSRVLIISTVWGSVGLGIGLAFAFPGAAVNSGRTAVFIGGLVLMVAGMALRWSARNRIAILSPLVSPITPSQVQAGLYAWRRDHRRLSKGFGPGRGFRGA